MKALRYERSVSRFAAARVASEWRSGSGARVGPLRLVEEEPLELPTSEWLRVRPRLAGICGSDLATVDGRSSRWFEPVVSFPFVPGHEVVGDTDDGRRVVVQPVLSCAVRDLDPPCPPCQAGRSNRCERLVAGHLQPGLQTGYCADTGGGWSAELVAHPAQLHEVPSELSDEAAVMVEPVACAVHGALAGPAGDDQVAVVIGAGTLGLAAIAAVRHYRPDVASVVVAAKHPEQRRWAATLGGGAPGGGGTGGGTEVVEPDELRRAVRRLTGGWILETGQLSAGASLVLDCVGSPASISLGLAVAAPGATLVLLGMPARVSVDLTPLWQREVSIRGAYAYGPEASQGGRHSFDLAFELTASARLERLVSATYPLERYEAAIAHAAEAGRRGAVKVAFDLRRGRRAMSSGSAAMREDA